MNNMRKHTRAAKFYSQNINQYNIRYMRTVKITEADSNYLYRLLQLEAYNQTEDKKEILQIAKLFKI